MRLSNMGEVNDFLSTIQRCRGDVWLEDTEGSKINLKSKLSQYVAIAALLSDHGEEMELYCSDRTDEAKFFVLFSDHPDII